MKTPREWAEWAAQNKGHMVGAPPETAKALERGFWLNIIEAAVAQAVAEASAGLSTELQQVRESAAAELATAAEQLRAAHLEVERLEGECARLAEEKATLERALQHVPHNCTTHPHLPCGGCRVEALLSK